MRPFLCVSQNNSEGNEGGWAPVHSEQKMGGEGAEQRSGFRNAGNGFLRACPEAAKINCLETAAQSLQHPSVHSVNWICGWTDPPAPVWNLPGQLTTHVHRWKWLGGAEIAGLWPHGLCSCMLGLLGEFLMEQMSQDLLGGGFINLCFLSLLFFYRYFRSFIKARACQIWHSVREVYNKINRCFVSSLWRDCGFSCKPCSVVKGQLPSHASGKTAVVAQMS